MYVVLDASRDFIVSSPLADDGYSKMKLDLNRTTLTPISRTNYLELE